MSTDDTTRFDASIVWILPFTSAMSVKNGGGAPLAGEAAAFTCSGGETENPAAAPPAARNLLRETPFCCGERPVEFEGSRRSLAMIDLPRSRRHRRASEV